jgi:hypothetical protein
MSHDLMNQCWNWLECYGEPFESQARRFAGRKSLTKTVS